MEANLNNDPMPHTAQLTVITVASVLSQRVIDHRGIGQHTVGSSTHGFRRIEVVSRATAGTNTPFEPSVASLGSVTSRLAGRPPEPRPLAPQAPTWPDRAWTSPLLCPRQANDLRRGRGARHASPARHDRVNIQRRVNEERRRQRFCQHPRRRHHAHLAHPRTRRIACARVDNVVIEQARGGCRPIDVRGRGSIGRVHGCFTSCFTQGRGLPSPGGRARLGSNNSGVSTAISASLSNHTIRASATRDGPLARHATTGITTGTVPTTLRTAMHTATRTCFTRRFTRGSVYCDAATSPAATIDGTSGIAVLGCVLASMIISRISNPTLAVARGAKAAQRPQVVAGR